MDVPYVKLEEMFRFFEEFETLNEFFPSPSTSRHFPLIFSQPQACHMNKSIFIFSPVYQQIFIILDILYKSTYIPERQRQIYHKANEHPLVS